MYVNNLSNDIFHNFINNHYILLYRYYIPLYCYISVILVI